ncbi:MAG: penicillin-binding protein [Polyangiaceae bacterium]
MTDAVVEVNELHGPRGKYIRLRMGLLCGLLAFGLGLVVASGFDLMVVHGAQWRELAERQRQRRMNVQPKRGSLYDRNGTALAISVEVPSVSLDAVELVKDVSPGELSKVVRDAATRIAAALSLDVATVERKILQKKRFSWLKRRISEDEVEAIRRLAIGDDVGRKIRGLSVEGEGHRYYPRRELAGPLLGFVAPDGQGKDGLELSLNADLQGQTDQLSGLRDRAGRLIFAEAVEDERVLAGHNISLTIDQGIQFAAENELANATRTFEATGGSVVVVEPNTGEILALASFPGYNPNDYSESDVSARRARGVSDTFEPGSSMKIFTIATGLATSAVGPAQQLFCEKGIMKVDNVFIRDTHPAEWLSLPKIMSLSSNICAAKVGLAVGGERLYESLRRFGFGQQTGLPFTGESTGTLRPRGRPWVDVETAAASFGQGISVTAIQLAMAASAIANGGELMEPILIKKVNTATGQLIRSSAPRVRRRVVPRHVAAQVAEMMIGVTEGEGTGVEAAIEGFEVAGKTATAQKTDPSTGRYSEDKFIASFVGFVPARRPAVAIAVVVDEPMVDHAGGNVAAPIFRRVAKMALEYKGLVPKGTPKVNVADLAKVPDPAERAYELFRSESDVTAPIQEVAPLPPVPAGSVRIPDMTGWPMREVLSHVSSLGLVPSIHGTGLLAKQAPSVGQSLAKGSTLELYFRPSS